MVTFSKFKVNAKESLINSASHILTGLMSKEDKILLDALVEANKSENVNNITINAPELDIINQEFESYNSQIEVNSKKIERLNTLIESQGYCGRVWDESSSSPTAKTYCGNLDMLRNLPDILGLGGYLVQNDHSRRKLAADNHYKFADDRTEAKLDGTMGHYQWGWNKPFYITTWKDNNLHYECISLEPIKGRESYYIPVSSMSAAGHATLDRDTNTLVSYCNTDSRYRGGNNNAEWDNESEKTLLGRCATYKTNAEFAEAAHKNGKGWFAGTMRMNAVVQILFRIIMGTRNSQAEFTATKNKDGLYECGLGVGITNLFDADWNVWSVYNSSNPFLSMSECVELGDFTGVSDPREITYKNLSNQDKTDSYTIPVFFGLKNPYGYIWRVSEDEFGKSNDIDMGMVHYIRKSLYSEDYVYGTINDAVMQGGTTPTGAVWIKELSYENLEMWPIVCSNGASASAYYCDLLYYYSPGFSVLHAVFRGGNIDNMSYAGVSVVSVGNGIEHCSAGIGSPLCEFTEDFLLEPIKL